jgi:hypothetical protein
MITTDNLQRIYVQVALGTPKSRSPFALTQEMPEAWDKITDEGLIQSAQFYLIFLLLVCVGGMVHAWFTARKFNRKNGIELR